MKENRLPIYDANDIPTGCCPRFKTEGWDEQELHFKNKLFVKATTRSLFHIPINMNRVFPKTFKQIEKEDNRFKVDLMCTEEVGFMSADDIPGINKNEIYILR